MAAELITLSRSLPALTIAIMVLIFPVHGQINTACSPSALTSFTSCFNFITNSTSNGTSPTTDCCNSLKSITSSGTNCLCLIVTGSVPFQIPFNRTLVIALPRACNMPGVPLQCKASASPLPAPANAQGGCFLQGINLEACRGQNLYTISGSCCRSLNQALQIGFHCLCSMLLPISTTSPILNFPSDVPLPNCYISVPSLAQCQAPIRGLFTPDIPVSPVLPKEIRQPTFSPALPSSNSTSDNSATITGPQNPTSKHASLSSSGNVTSHCDHKLKNQLHQSVPLLVITHSLYLIANCIHLI